MPIYEFYSPDTHKIYSFYARRILARGEVPRCPEGSGHRMERVLSPFAVTGRAKEPQADGGSGADDLDPRLEAEMMRMAGEMSSLDDENPDPRQLGRMMRRMIEITGEKMPEPMLEMLARMEKGEDPEKLEEEYGDVLDDESFPAGGSAEDGAAGGGVSTLRRKLPPRRDPKLYELSEYL